MKMSETFNLPVVNGNEIPVLKDANGGMIFIGNCDHTTATAFAINNNDRLIDFVKMVRDCDPARWDELPNIATVLLGVIGE